MNVVRTAELAAILGVSGRRVRQMATRGMPRVGRGRFNAAECVRWHANLLEEASRKRIEGSKKGAEARRTEKPPRVCKGCGNEPDPRSPYCSPCRGKARERSRDRYAPKRKARQWRRDNTPEWVPIARRMWESGYEVEEICRLCDVSSPSLYVYKRLGSWDLAARDRGRYRHKYPWLDDARQRYEGGDLIRELAGVYGVSGTTMRTLAREMAWGHRAHRRARFNRLNPTDGRRVCKGCDREKDIAEFPVINDSRRRQGRRRSRCTDCWSLHRQAYRHENPDKRRGWDRRRRRRMREQADGTLTHSVLVRLYRKAKVCPYCTTGLKKGSKSLDHIEPLSKGGCHGLSNVVVCCRDCNTRKRDQEFSEWLSKLSDTQRASAERAYRMAKGASHQQAELCLAA